MEMWDIYDRDRVKTGKTISRAEKLPEGSYHIVVHILIMNSKNEMLIQKRTLTKDKWPGRWDISIGGSIVAGEDSRIGAIRESKEEIGYDVNLENVRPAITFNFERGFDDYYIILDDVDINTLKLQEEEVDEVKWASREEVIEMIKNNEFVNHHISFMNLMFDLADEMRKKAKEH